MALHIAGVLHVSIVATALNLHAAFGVRPESGRKAEEVVRFAIGYTFWLNLAAPAVAAAMLRLLFLHRREIDAHASRMEGDGPLKRAAARVAMGILAVGAAASAGA